MSEKVNAFVTLLDITTSPFGAVLFAFLPAVDESAFHHSLANRLYCQTFGFFPALIGEKGFLSVALICISFIVSKMEHIFIYLMLICIYFSVNHLLAHLCSFPLPPLSFSFLCKGGASPLCSKQDAP